MRVNSLIERASVGNFLFQGAWNRGPMPPDYAYEAAGR
jgi:hypothetical protein